MTDRTQLSPDAASTAGPVPLLKIENLAAGYAGTEILHGIDMCLDAAKSLCLVGPNGAGKSTVLNAIFGFADIGRGSITVNGREIDRRDARTRLRDQRIAYVLQDSSVFPDMSVEQNLRLGGHLMPTASAANSAAERIFERYPRLAARRRDPASVLSGGERRLLEIARALMMEPTLLLIDEPSIGLEPRYVDLVFDMLGQLQAHNGTAILLVEQNVRKGLAFADHACVLVAGTIALTGAAGDIARDPSIGRLFLGQ